MLRLCYDSLAAIVLLASAVSAVQAWRLAFGGRTGQFSAVAAAGTAYLGIDELLSLHERLGHAMYYDLGWREPPGINHFDDLIVMGVALAGLGVFAVYRDEVFRLPAFAGLVSLGLAFFAAAIGWDTVANPSHTASWWTEETLELAGALAMLGAFRLRLRAARSLARSAAAASRIEGRAVADCELP